VFGPAVGIAIGLRSDKMPPGFLEDRSKFNGRDINPERLKAAVPMFTDQLRPHYAWYESMLADGRPFLTGAHPTLVDTAIYHPCWFIRRIAGPIAPLDELPRLQAWMDRMEKIGHGKPTDLDAQQALAIARDAQPQTQRQDDPHDPFGRKPGMQVTVTPDDTGKDPVAGELIALSPLEIVIRRRDPQVGEVDVHFPRAGFGVQAAKA
jgi:glutathione S-transferase